MIGTSSASVRVVATLSWAKRTVLRPGREEPYLSIQDIVVFVRDLEVSKRLYLQQLGFELITEQRLPTGERWIEVAPPDGSANLAPVEPKPDQPEYKLIGGYRWVLFMIEDVHAKYKEWSERGVRFLAAPETPGGAAPARVSRIRTGMRLAWQGLLVRILWSSSETPASTKVIEHDHIGV